MLKPNASLVSLCLLFVVGACGGPEEAPRTAPPAQRSALGESVGELLRDFTTNNRSTGPQSLAERAAVGATLYFAASELETGEELWKTDGTAAGTVRVKDIRDVGSSFPRQLTAVASQLYFSAEDDTSGREVWVSDGTQAGTVRVKDVRPGAARSSSSPMTASMGPSCGRRTAPKAAPCSSRTSSRVEWARRPRS